MEVMALAAFLGGLVSFLSPCVLPLVPGYVSMLSGIGVDQLKESEGSSGRLMSTASAFVIGFSAVFITMGATASAVGAFLLRNRASLAPIAGALIILFGLHLIGWLPKISVRVGLIVGAILVALGLLIYLRTDANFVLKPEHFYAVSSIFLLGPSLSRWLNRDMHLRKVGGNRPGMVSGFLLGFAFAFGWTPCIGPILTSVLAIAATREKATEGVILLAFYSAGLAIPFLLTAVGIERFIKFYQKFRKHLHTVEVLSGVLLLAVGALVFVNGLALLSSRMAGLNPEYIVDRLVHHAQPASADAGAPPNSSLQDEPDVSFELLQGQNIPLASLKGKVVLVNFWGTWCDPCRIEIPWLIDFQQKYASQGFTLVGVAMEEPSKSVVESFIANNEFDVSGEKLKINYPVVMGNEDIAEKFGGLLGYPSSFLISRDGKIVKRIIGLVSEDELAREIELQLAVPAPASSASATTATP